MTTPAPRERATHTPGPWMVSEPANQEFAVSIGSYAYVCPAGSAQVRANLPSNAALIPFGIVHHADASLMAAAPELLAALHAMVATFAVGFEPGASPAVDAARAAIAKATGSAA